MTSAQRIQELIARGEFTKFDLKAKLSCENKSEKAELVKDIIAIANPPGEVGHLLFGVSDDGQPSGQLNTTITEEQIQKIVKEYTTPYIETSYEIVPCINQSTGILTIRREPSKLPYRVAKSVGGNKQAINKDDIFYRHGRHSEKATYEEIRTLIFEGERARQRVMPRTRSHFADEYAMLDISNRSFEMLKDFEDILFYELGFTQRLWQMEKRVPGAVLYFSAERARKFDAEVVDRVVGGCHYLFMLYVHPSDLSSMDHLKFHKYAFEMIPNPNKSYNWKRVIVIVVYGKAAKQSFKPFIEPRINNILVKTSFGYYCGPSELTARTLHTWEPRLYLTNIVSKECMKSRLQEALSWIETCPDLAEPAPKIHSSFKRYPSREILSI